MATQEDVILIPAEFTNPHYIPTWVYRKLIEAHRYGFKIYVMGGELHSEFPREIADKLEVTELSTHGLFSERVHEVRMRASNASFVLNLKRPDISKTDVPHNYGALAGPRPAIKFDLVEPHEVFLDYDGLDYKKILMTGEHSLVIVNSSVVPLQTYSKKVGDATYNLYNRTDGLYLESDIYPVLVGDYIKLIEKGLVQPAPMDLILNHKKLLGMTRLERESLKPDIEYTDLLEIGNSKRRILTSLCLNCFVDSDDPEEQIPNSEEYFNALLDLAGGYPVLMVAQSEDLEHYEELQGFFRRKGILYSTLLT
jgi:hypothetical protein